MKISPNDYVEAELKYLGVCGTDNIFNTWTSRIMQIINAKAPSVELVPNINDYTPR